MTNMPARPVPLRLIDESMQQVTDRLIADYRDYLPIGSIVRCVARSIESVGRADGLNRAEAVERVARERLERRLGTGTWRAA